MRGSSPCIVDIATTLFVERRVADPVGHDRAGPDLVADHLGLDDGGPAGDGVRRGRGGHRRRARPDRQPTSGRAAPIRSGRLRRRTGSGELVEGEEGGEDHDADQQARRAPAPTDRGPRPSCRWPGRRSACPWRAASARAPAARRRR